MHEPKVPSVEVRLVHGLVGVERHLLRIRLVSGERAPEVRQIVIAVVDRLDSRRVRPTEEDRQGSSERLDVVARVAEPIPDETSHTRFPAEPWERRTKNGLVGHGVRLVFLRHTAILRAWASRLAALTNLPVGSI